mgnify:CR=1 FL=1
MSYQGKASALQQYGQVGVQSGVACATPHRLIQMLFDGALDKLALARGHMQRGEVALKGSHIGWVISIIDGLRMSLDKEAGGEIAQVRVARTRHRRGESAHHFESHSSVGATVARGQRDPGDLAGNPQ